MEGPKFKAFIIEDNEWYNKLLKHTISLDPDFQVYTYHSAKDALKDLYLAPDIVTVDYRLPDMMGDTLFENLKEKCPNTEVIFVSEQEDIQTAINMLKLGAFDYLVKSEEIKERLLISLRNFKSRSQLKERIEHLENEVQQKYEFEKSILGNSKAIQQVFELLKKALTSNINVIVNGETGTGKELIAKAIHYNSTFKQQNFVTVNVAAIPKELFESEFFGHEKGAFTGAITQRKGKFEESNNGTLFLDEIGELDLIFQAKLLRALQEREFTRVGGNEVIKFNTRLIVATHKNLLEEVKKGNFREDLYYRLLGLPINLPPLREREKDILLLANSFITGFAKENSLAIKTLSGDAQTKLMAYPWPGNIRELKSVVELSVVLSSGEQIKAEDILLSSASEISSIIAEELTLKEYNMKIVQLFLSKYQQNTKIVAEKLGIGQTTIYRMLKGEE
ncbi:MAG: sigma-54 dependent transcriptional regulator [Bacteroidota bacterium]